jgi:hypothetical protein
MSIDSDGVCAAYPYPKTPRNGETSGYSQNNQFKKTFPRSPRPFSKRDMDHVMSPMNGRLPRFVPENPKSQITRLMIDGQESGLRISHSSRRPKIIRFLHHQKRQTKRLIHQTSPSHRSSFWKLIFSGKCRKHTRHDIVNYRLITYRLSSFTLKHYHHRQYQEYIDKLQEYFCVTNEREIRAV